VMGLLSPLVVTDDPVRVWGLPPAVQQAYQAEVDRYWSENPDGDGSGRPRPPIEQCTWYDDVQQNVHTERIWWITVINPFVVVADAAPLPAGAYADLSAYASTASDPLAWIRLGVRSMARAPDTERDDCTWLYEESDGYIVEYEADGSTRITTSTGTPVNVDSPVKRRPVTVDSPIWPLGLGANLLLGAVFFWLAVQRLKVPYGQLARGTRVA
jgi:hypothetical protein